MECYVRRPDDYALETGHLSMLQHGAYTLLTHEYYSREEAIPDEDKYCLAGARTDDERAAVDAVLREFFKLTDGLWTQGRIEKEIADYQRDVACTLAQGAANFDSEPDEAFDWFTMLASVGPVAKRLAVQFPRGARVDWELVFEKLSKGLADMPPAEIWRGLAACRTRVCPPSTG